MHHLHQLERLKLVVSNTYSFPEMIKTIPSKAPVCQIRLSFVARGGLHQIGDIDWHNIDGMLASRRRVAKLIIETQSSELSALQS